MCDPLSKIIIVKELVQSNTLTLFTRKHYFLVVVCSFLHLFHRPLTGSNIGGIKILVRGTPIYNRSIIMRARQRSS